MSKVITCTFDHNYVAVADCCSIGCAAKVAVVIDVNNNGALVQRWLLRCLRCTLTEATKCQYELNMNSPDLVRIELENNCVNQ